MMDCSYIAQSDLPRQQVGILDPAFPEIQEFKLASIESIANFLEMLHCFQYSLNFDCYHSFSKKGQCGQISTKTLLMQQIPSVQTLLLCQQLLARPLMLDLCQLFILLLPCNDAFVNCNLLRTSTNITQFAFFSIHVQI